MLVEHLVGSMDNGADFGGRLDWDKPVPWEWTSHSSDWSAGGGDESVTVCNLPPRNSSACTEVRTPVVVALTPPAVKHEEEAADLTASRTKEKAEKTMNDPVAQNFSGQKDFFLGLGGGAPAEKSDLGSMEQGGKQVVNQDAETGLQLELKRSFTPPEGNTNKGSPCKKPRGSANHMPRCQVEGCKTDLSSAKDYHRRHKVCAMHSKSAKVSVNSIEQRFCQQCSRFHVLSEFDEGKRSCRRRLAGHNERRRKPQPDPMALTTAALSPYHAGFMRLAQERLLYGTPISYLGDNLHGKLSWPRFGHIEDHTGLSAGTNSFSRPERVFMLFPPRKVPPILTSVNGAHQFMQGSGSIMGQNLSLSSSSGTGVYTGLGPPASSTTATTTLSDSGRALSLLSSQSWATDSSSSIEQLMSENRATTGYKAGFPSQQLPSLSGGVQSQGTSFLHAPSTSVSASYENHHHPTVITLLQGQQRPTMDFMQSAPTVVQQPQDFQVLKPYGSTAMYDPHQI